MKKLIILSMVCLVSSVYAGQDSQVKTAKLDSKIIIKNNSQEEIKIESPELTQNNTKPNNETFLYTFDFANVGKSDKSVYKYVTNNLQTVATIKALQDTMKKNWNLNSDYSKNLKLTTENKVANSLVCKYNNGLVIKIKPYGDYSTNCPLKYIV